MHSYFLSMLLIAASIGIASAVWGAVYVLILTDTGHILSGWKRLLHETYDKIFKRDTEAWYKYKWLLQPIVECELCVSGQIALWTYLITQPFHIFGLIFSICQAVLTAWLIARVMSLLTK